MVHPSENAVVINRIPRPKPDEVLYTHALSFASLENFIATGTCCSSDDDLEASRRTFTAVGLEEDVLNARFTSVIASISESFKSSQPNAGYSEGDNLFLILDPVRIASRVYVFNGDVKGLGNTVGKTLDASTEIVVFRPSLIDLHTALKDLLANDRHPVRSPRRRGYFEARVIGGIAREDVKQVCIPAGSSKTIMEAINRFWGLQPQSCNDE
jgi:hypothetical protein